MLALIVAAVLAQAGGGAVAAAPATKPTVIVQPDWLRRPSAEDMARFYPKGATAANLEGQATLHCLVTAEGLLSACTVDESPGGQGFGEAALNLAQLFKMRPMTRNGVPVDGGKINIPIRFQLPRNPMPSLTLATRCYGLAAAAAERDPASADAQVAVATWRVMLDVASLQERQRPSEFEQLLAELRKSAAGRLDDPGAKADRDECAAALPANAPLLNQLRAVAR
jgi:TonB family protein